MQIDWAALGSVFVVALIASVALVVVFALGVRLYSLGGAGSASGSGTASTGSALPRLGAVICFALCAIGVLFGVWLIVPFFH
ncbi:hypothetical protein FJ658_06775 [Schumannella sp. 10F1B-5-1]|nr:hypothetical protein FJ658_06775 [Schumannella sp. 10F1B-5-1]